MKHFNCRNIFLFILILFFSFCGLVIFILLKQKKVCEIHNAKSFIKRHGEDTALYINDEEHNERDYKIIIKSILLVVNTTDLWGNLYRYEIITKNNKKYLQVKSAGFDKKYGTQDDLIWISKEIWGNN